VFSIMNKHTHTHTHTHTQTHTHTNPYFSFILSNIHNLQCIGEIVVPSSYTCILGRESRDGSKLSWFGILFQNLERSFYHFLQSLHIYWVLSLFQQSCYIVTLVVSVLSLSDHHLTWIFFLERHLLIGLPCTDHIFRYTVINWLQINRYYIRHILSEFYS
jgi:hypothetical protein